MSKIKLNFLLIFALIVLITCCFFIKDFRIDASSDTLVAKNDEDFQYFNDYTKLFNSENFLVIAVENKNKIKNEFIKNFEFLSSEILKLDQVSEVFSFIDAPILFLNNTTLSSLNNINIENLRNTKLNIEDVIDEFKNNPIYKDQIINNDANVFSLIIYLKKNLELDNAKNDFEKFLISKKK